MKATKLLLFCIIIINSFSSCYQDTGEFFRTTSIILSADSNLKKPGRTINFTVKTDSGLDVTNEATIYIKEITSSSEPEIINEPNITSQVDKIYKVYAKYKEYTSEEINVEFNINAESFVKRLLIEDYTGTWCVNCPTVSYAIDLLKEKTDKIVPVAIHRGPNAASYDPFNFEEASVLENLFGFPNQYPTSMLNRTTYWASPVSANGQNNALNLTSGTPVRLGLAMNSTKTGNNINLDVKVKFFQDYSNLKLVVYVLENKLIYPQENGTIYYDGIDVLEDFEHNHVLRATYTDILGDAIPSSETTYGKTFTRNFSVAVPSNIANTANMEFVAFVIGSNNKSINVRSAAVGVNQEFEENN